jgi:hypothetical protein
MENPDKRKGNRNREDEKLSNLMLSLEALDGVLTAISPVGVSFRPKHPVCEPRLFPAELGVITLVSWLYVIFFEIARVDTKYLLSKLEIFVPSNERESRDFVQTINCLRTFFQHYLDLSNNRNAAKHEHCEAWFVQVCGKSRPISSGDWLRCLYRLLDASLVLVATLRACAEAISTSESKHLLLAEWESRVNTWRSREEWRALLEEVVLDIGREELVLESVLDRFASDWNKNLQFVGAKHEFKDIGRRIIESTLLKDDVRLCPVSARDIMVTFALDPGPKVGELLKLTHALYLEQPCGKDALLSRIKETT